MQLHFAVDHSPDSLDEAMRLVVLLASANDFVARRMARPAAILRVADARL
jgi:hypothetical protein